MRDLVDPRWIKLKGFLFLLIGAASAVLLWLECPTWKAEILIAVVVWSFCRAYYFAFYVIEHYVDPQFRFAGLIAFARYLLARKR